MSERPIIGMNGGGAGGGTRDADTQERALPEPTAPKEHATGLPAWDLEPPMRLVRRGE
jgi:hypothetical protein